MPCSDGYSRYEGPNYFHEAEVARLKKRNDKLAKMLCGVMTVLEGTKLAGPVINMDYLYDNVPKLEKWWEEHKAFDKSEGR